jgi:subtilisin family serine protease
LAENEGILVLDCTVDHGRVFAGYYDLASPDDITKFSLGFPSAETTVTTRLLYAPTSNRTTAEEYFQGEYANQFTGQGGLSWAIPYVTGVLALGWQLRPELTGEQMLTLAFASAYEKDGAKIIDPPAFIEKVRAF